MVNLSIIFGYFRSLQSPDIRQFITITLPEHLQPKDSVDNILHSRQEDLPEAINRDLRDIDEFLPEEVATLPHEARDVLKRLLEFDGQKRLHSVRALQKIAMYKDFKIEAKYLLNVSRGVFGKEDL